MHEKVALRWIKNKFKNGFGSKEMTLIFAVPKRKGSIAQLVQSIPTNRREGWPERLPNTNNDCSSLKYREHSSAGSEHLPYKQRVRGSNPCAPTDKVLKVAPRATFAF